MQNKRLEEINEGMNAIMILLPYQKVVRVC